jgi:peptidoglycan/xylan/chitin deacetylase (PgdA/CDA1 family)
MIEVRSRTLRVPRVMAFFGGKEAAVSLTFDDGLDVHFTNVMPLLEQ